jgi:hypothetical protein
MRGLALAEIAAVDLDICCLWLVAAPELPFGDQLKRFVAGRMPQRREDRGRGQQHRFRRIEARGFERQAARTLLLTLVHCCAVPLQAANRGAQHMRSAIPVTVLATSTAWATSTHELHHEDIQGRQEWQRQTVMPG